MFNILCALIKSIFQVNIAKKLKIYYQSSLFSYICLNDFHSYFASLTQIVITAPCLIFLVETIN